MCLIVLVLTASCGRKSTTKYSSSVDSLIPALENDGFVVKEGNYINVDAIDLLNRGIIRSANGNNSGNPYFTPLAQNLA